MNKLQKEMIKWWNKDFKKIWNSWESIHCEKSEGKIRKNKKGINKKW
jgi:hypothetical protein